MIKFNRIIALGALVSVFYLSGYASSQQYFSTISGNSKTDTWSVYMPSACTIVSTATYSNPSAPFGGGQGEGKVSNSSGTVVLDAWYGSNMSGSVTRNYSGPSDLYGLSQFVSASPGTTATVTTTFTW